MIRKTLNTLVAGLVAGMLASTATIAPAQAGGSISITVAPKNADEEKLMKAGLAIYAISQGIKNGSIKQNGSGNMAGLLQNGHGNLGVVHQEGSGHNGTLQQNGNHNSYGLFQFGKNTNGHVVQNGNGGAGTTFQFGW
jgi:hypothetical protein